MTAPSTPLSQVCFVSLDVETTGLDPHRDQIVEIAAVKVKNGTVVEEWDTLISIDRVIPYEARRVHGISDAMLVGKPRIHEAIPTFLRFANNGVLVEHSYKAFDVAFLEHAHGRQLDVPYVNTCTLSRKLFPFMRKHSLEECCRRHNIVNEGAHRALSDARATAQLLICLLELCGTHYPRLQDLIRVASVER
jgi:DNA polymerase III epsilon subunit family exonuclease